MQLALPDTKLLLIAGLLFLVGVLSGWLGFLMLGDIAGSCRVVFVSKEAIVKMEEKRLVHNKDSQASMFFGKPEIALNLMEKVASSFATKRTKVLFISTDTGTIKGGEAISAQVYDEVVQSLAKTSDSAIKNKTAAEDPR
jgi:hypothetical protein